MKGLYRLPLDYLEEVTTGMADRIFVNSGFTKEVWCSYCFLFTLLFVLAVFLRKFGDRRCRVSDPNLPYRM
jgi:hypothetical protein